MPSLELFRQPILTRDRLLVSHEVLVRPSGNGLPFVEVARLPAHERGPIELEALRLALGVALSGGPHSINVSPWLLMQSRAMDVILRTVRLMPPKALTIELLEYDLVALDGLEDVLRVLHRAGARISVDDFGQHAMGVALLASDAGLIDEVKLDSSLVHCHRRDRLLPALVNLVHQAGAVAVAEYVDSPDCLAQVMTAGVDRIQGFHLGTPEPVGAQVPELLADQVMPRLRVAVG